MKPSLLLNIALQTVSEIATLRRHLKAQRSLALVPTMGNLHEGHLALVKLAKERADHVVVSIFVNPLQFGANEDFNQYPRTLKEDEHKLRASGADVLFTPSNVELFPEPQSFHVQPPDIANDLCGRFRPGHFQGVATIITKLFNIVRPQVAVFGKKDYQQLHVIRQLIAQLNFAIDIVAAETVRASDGLALSSRNLFLSAEERKEASALYRVLAEVKSNLLEGAQDFSKLERVAGDKLTELGWRVDYISLRNSGDLSPARATDKRLVIMAAGWIGKTRLIDNIEVEL